jgi:hypothetical protein
MSGSLLWIERRLANAWGRAQDSVATDAGDLAIARVVFGLFALVLNPPSLSWLGELPAVLFHPQPLNMTRFFSGFPSRPWLMVNDVALVLAAACIVLGVRTRITGPIFALLFVFGNGFRYSLGKIDHVIMFPLSILILSASNWGTACALVPDPRRERSVDRAAPALLAILLCYAFFTAGALKALFWCDLDPDTGGFLQWYYNRRFGESNAPLAGLVTRMPQSLFELLDVGAVCFELAPFAMLMLGWRWWRAWLVMACLFHIATILLLDISFIDHIPVYLAFIPAGQVAARLASRITPEARWTGARRYGRWLACLAVGGVTVMHLTRISQQLAPTSPLGLLWNVFLPASLYGAVVPLAMWLLTVVVVALSVSGPAPPLAEPDGGGN